MRDVFQVILALVFGLGAPAAIVGGAILMVLLARATSVNLGQVLLAAVVVLPIAAGLANSLAAKRRHPGASEEEDAWRSRRAA